MKKAFYALITSLLLIGISSSLYAQNTRDFEHRYDPPWQPSSLQGTLFLPYGIDNAPDFHGDVNNPDLVIFFAGNQYMAVPDLLKAFKKAYPQCKSVFAETIPPGIEEKQIKEGGLVLGNMRIALKPDIITAGKGNMEQKDRKGWFDTTQTYAKNKLAIMVRQGNPKHIEELQDLARPDVKVSMPNPQWEGIATRIIKAYDKAGGKHLENTIMKDKLAKNTTYLTTIHHRQTPMRIMYGRSDAGPVWYSEAYYQSTLSGNPIGMVIIPDSVNVKATYVAGLLKNAPHPNAATAFMHFLGSETAHNIYAKYGFISVK